MNKTLFTLLLAAGLLTGCSTTQESDQSRR